MKLSMKPLLLAVAVAGLFVPSNPVHAAGKGKAAAPAKSALICPVTGQKISSVKAAVGHSTYKGKTYYFCCGMCKPRFDKNPAKYIQNAAHGKFEKM